MPQCARDNHTAGRAGLGWWCVMGLGVVVMGVVVLAPLWVSAGGGWSWGGWVTAMVWVGGMLVLVLALGLMPWWTRGYAVQELVLIALTFGLALVVLGLPGAVIGALPAVFLGPFAFLLQDLWFKQAFFVVLGVLVGLVRRPGVYFLFHLLWMASQSLLQGYFSPGLILLGGSSVFLLEVGLWVGGVTRRGSHAAAVSGGVVLGGALMAGGAMGLVVWMSLELLRWLYRLEFSWWYMGLQVVSGGLNGGLGMGMGLWLSRRLWKLRRNWGVWGGGEDGGGVLGKREEVGVAGDVPLWCEGLSFVPAGGVDLLYCGVDLELRQGELVGLSGVSGSGKSSVLWQLQGLLGANGGKVGGGGRRLEWWGRWHWARRCGLLFQEVRPQLLRSGVWEEVILAAGMSGLSERRARWAAEGALSRFGLGRMCDRRLGSLSGGEMQRLAMAALWAGRHRVLLLDEPLSHQDARWRRRLVGEFRRQARRGIALLVAEHRVRALGKRGIRWLYLDGKGGGLQEGTGKGGGVLGGLGARGAGRAFTAKAGCVDSGEKLCLRGLRLGRGERDGDGWQLGPVEACLEKGMVVALGGANGSGKSSLMEVCLGLRVPWEGEVCWERSGEKGRLVQKLSVRERAQLFGWLPQDSDLALGAPTVEEELVRSVRLRGMGKEEGRRLVEKWLVRLGLEDAGGQPLLLMSVGERQRVALGAAMVHAPQLLLLDEPFAGLDEAQAQELMGLLCEAVREGWVGALLLATHDAHLVSGCVDAWWVLRNGRLRVVDAVSMARR